jgi:hypothetical protein
MLNKMKYISWHFACKSNHKELIRRWKTKNKYDISIECSFLRSECRMPKILLHRLYSASHSRVAPKNVGLQKEQKYNTFACRSCNEVRLCVLGIRKKEVGNTKR